MKSKLTINVETLLLEDGKNNNINFSSTMEEALKSKLAFMKGEISGIDKRLLCLEIEKIQRKMSENGIKLADLKEKLARIEEIESENKEKSLKEEKEKIELLKKCSICSNDLNDFNTLEYRKGVLICKSCFNEKNVTKILKEKGLI